MNSLIDELKKEHQDIMALLIKIQDAGADAPGSRELLQPAKTKCFNHLQKEDISLYPVLREAARQDRKVAAVVDEFTRNTARITEETREFFCHLDANKVLSSEFEHVFTDLWPRMLKEELVLFAEYQKLRG